MGTIVKNLNLILNGAQKTSVALCNNILSNIYDLPSNYAFTLVIDGSTASGVLNIYIQNENITQTNFMGLPILTYNIINGVFSGGETIQTFDNNGFTFTKYLGFYWQPTISSTTDNISISGQITYN